MRLLANISQYGIEFYHNLDNDQAYEYAFIKNISKYRGGAYNELRLFDIVLSDICGYDLCFTNK